MHPKLERDLEHLPEILQSALQTAQGCFAAIRPCAAFFTPSFYNGVPGVRAAFRH